MKSSKICAKCEKDDVRKTRVNDKNEKYIEYKLWEYDVRKEELAIKILKLIKEYDRISESKLYKRYFDNLYSYSGEWGIDNYYDNNRTPNKDKLEKLTNESN